MGSSTINHDQNLRFSYQSHHGSNPWPNENAENDPNPIKEFKDNTKKSKLGDSGSIISVSRFYAFGSSNSTCWPSKTVRTCKCFIGHSWPWLQRAAHLKHKPFRLWSAYSTSDKCKRLVCLAAVIVVGGVVCDVLTCCVGDVWSIWDGAGRVRHWVEEWLFQLGLWTCLLGRLERCSYQFTHNPWF